MNIFIVVVLLIVTLTMIGVILLQKSEGGGLGSSGGAGSMGGIMSTRTKTNFLTRTTAILGALFFGICLLLAILVRKDFESNKSLFEESPAQVEKVTEEIVEQAQPEAPTA